MCTEDNNDIHNPFVEPSVENTMTHFNNNQDNDAIQHSSTPAFGFTANLYEQSKQSFGGLNAPQEQVNHLASSFGNPPRVDMAMYA